MEVSNLINVIIVDDEILALDYLELQLKKFDEIHIIDKFENPVDLLEKLNKRKMDIDIVFLDISMPELSGIEVAKEVMKCSPHTQIVFTSAYDSYAIQAFELNVVDYLLKPIQHHRLLKSIERCKQRLKNSKPTTSTQPKLMVCAFHSLRFKKLNHSNEPFLVKWRTAKVRGVFSFLLHSHGKYITKDLLVELFWPSVPLEKAFSQLYSAIYQIRKSLTAHQIPITITNIDNGYILELNNTVYDVDLFEQNLHKLPKLTEDTLDIHLELIDLYSGDLFYKEDYTWAESSRERLRMMLIKLIRTVCDFYEDNDNFKDAIALYLHLQSLYPYYENSYLKLVKLYKEIGNFNDAKSQYNQLANMLKSEYSLSTTEEINRWLSENHEH